SIGPVGPAVSSSADQTHPGPDTKAPATVSSPGLLLGAVSSTAGATGAGTSAASQPKAATGTANLTGLNVGLTALSLPILTNLTTTSSVSTGGTVSAASQCVATGTSTATTTALSDLRVTMLGGAATPLAVTGNTGTASVVSLTA